MSDTVPVSIIQEKLYSEYEHLGYSRAGFNIHDSSDSMNDSDVHCGVICVLLDLLGDNFEQNKVTQNYTKGYAQYTKDNDVFKRVNSKSNRSDELFPVCDESEVDFSEHENWELFCQVFKSLKA